AARFADDASWAARRAVVVGGDREPGQRILRVHAHAAGRHARSLYLARLLPLLRVLGSDARADVFPDRRMGWAEKTVRRHQILFIYAGWIGSFTARNSGSVFHLSQHCCTASGDRRTVRYGFNVRRAGIPCNCSVLAI